MTMLMAECRTGARRLALNQTIINPPAEKPIRTARTNPPEGQGEEPASAGSSRRSAVVRPFTHAVGHVQSIFSGVATSYIRVNHQGKTEQQGSPAGNMGRVLDTNTAPKDDMAHFVKSSAGTFAHEPGASV
ncbi:hypothetical protein N7510_010455 [Penicillium lagena]|uniref:uncharacterized protein n=1 Tax=Penicillium lagena TaxID=94218 RepID=UPI002541F3FE|nr:uncharacterized protein N7510_010455 [Penicillium lagena]KAJ5605301.1 hypothetical protein N7510_010455 [Penicillium lagena]